MGISSEGLSAEFQEPLGPAGVRVRDRPRTPLQPGHVAVAIKAASLNHLDLWLASGAQRVTPPRVICADGAGVVEESDDPRWKPGDEVVIFPTVADGTCDQCLAGREVFCPNFGTLGEHSDGAACQRLQLPARMVYQKPSGLSWEEAAAFPLTFLTAYRMLTTRARLQPGETLVVVGAGAGVGVAAILIGKSLGARVVATSRSPEKLARAAKLGADAAFPTDGFSAAVRELTGKGADVVFDSVGAATANEDLKAVRLGGRIVTCGSTSGPNVTLSWPRLFFKQADILGSTMGNASEFEDVLNLVATGVRPAVDSVYALADVEAALARLDSGAQFGKVVLKVAD